MRTLTENILINENPAFIWDLLLKSHEYENWNPIYNYIEGDIELGESLTIEVQLNIEDILKYVDKESAPLYKAQGTPRPQKWKYKVTKLVENELMEWKMSKLGGFLIGGSHVFRLGQLENGKTMFEMTIGVGGIVGNIMPDKIFYPYNKAMVLAFLNSFKWYVEEGSQTKHELPS